MLACSLRGIRQVKEEFVKTFQACFHRFSFGVLMMKESFFQGLVLLIKLLKKLDEIKRIGSIEGAMFEVLKWLEVDLAMVQNEVIRCIVHHFK